MNYQDVVRIVELFVKNYKNPEESEAEMESMLNCLRIYRDEQWGKDNRIHFVSALVDGLSYHKFWTLMDLEQFISLADIVRSLKDRDVWEDEDIDVAIFKLDRLGIDTTPF